MSVHPHPKLLYPSMVIAAIAVTVFSLLGIATLTGALPYAHSETASGYSIDEKPNDRKIDTTEKIAALCGSCGVVESVRAIEVKGEGSGIGVVAGGLTGALLGSGVGHGNGRTAATVLGAAGGAYAGNEIEKNTKKHASYRVRVRMSDDSLRTIYQRATPGVTAGDRVKIVDGTVVQQS
jgi:outer membrane lipoprotein SlyB